MNDTVAPEFAPDFSLDVTLVDAGPAATGHSTSTNDGCGSGNTGSSACTTRCDAGN